MQCPMVTLCNTCQQAATACCAYASEPLWMGPIAELQQLSTGSVLSVNVSPQGSLHRAAPQHHFSAGRFALVEARQHHKPTISKVCTAAPPFKG